MLSPESRAALTLRLVGGLTTAEIARGFLVTESTMGQRISRAKRTLSAAHAELELPTGAERLRRLDDVMAVIYLIFNEGYTATAGADSMRPDLTGEATRLARMLVEVAPDEPEVLGLQALLEIQASRTAARARPGRHPGPAGGAGPDAVGPVADPRGLAALRRAEQLAARGKPVGKYFLQASIAAQHARAARAEDTDWRRIAALYDVLAGAAPGPVVEVNRAVAYGRAFGPESGLAVLEELDATSARRLAAPAQRARRPARTGPGGTRPASAAFTEAAARATNESERALLLRRAESDSDRAEAVAAAATGVIQRAAPGVLQLAPDVADVDVEQEVRLRRSSPGHTARPSSRLDQAYVGRFAIASSDVDLRGGQRERRAVEPGHPAARGPRPGRRRPGTGRVAGAGGVRQPVRAPRSRAAGDTASGRHRVRHQAEPGPAQQRRRHAPRPRGSRTASPGSRRRRARGRPAGRSRRCGR